MDEFENSWKISDDPGINVSVAFAIVKAISATVREQMPEFADAFPFRMQWRAEGYLQRDSFAIQLRDMNNRVVIF